MRLFLCLFVLSCLSGCGGGPRYNVIPWANALKLESMMEMRILDIHDGLHHSREPHVTHLVSVEILDGPQSVIGKRITLPYDSYNCGKEPPSPGTEVLIAPSSWLKRDFRSFGRGNRQ